MRDVPYEPDEHRRVRRDELPRYRLASRAVIYAMALGAIDGTFAATRALFRWAVEQPFDKLAAYVAGLEEECRERGKVNALGFAEAIENYGSELPFKLEE
jgi:hypothetical protein